MQVARVAARSEVDGLVKAALVVGTVMAVPLAAATS
jgi:hypothetical protein